MLRFHFTRVSSNVKTGPIPTVLISRNTCPPSCPLYNGGCYALGGNVRIHWNRASNQGGTFEQLLANIKGLPYGQVWRYGVAGDLPGVEEKINPFHMRKLVKENKGRKGYAYTHKNPHIKSNAALIKSANKNGFTVNLSSNNVEQADEYLALGIAPVVTLIPSDFSEGKPWKHTRTPQGNRVVQCPAEYQDNVTCATCGGRDGPLCTRAGRNYVVGFTAHGASKRKTSNIARKGLAIIQ